MGSDPTSLPGRAAPQRWAVLERVSKVATILSILLVGSVQLAVAPEAGWPVRLLAGGAFLVAWMCGARWNQGTSAAVLFVAPMVPVLLATLAAISGPTSETVWLVAVVGFTLPRISWSRWELPSVWGLLLGGWALTVSLAWPVLVARELGFDVRVVTDVAAINSWAGLSAPHVIAWILHTTLVHLTGLLWLEWLLTRSLTPSRTPPVGHALWIGVTVASVVAIVQGVIDIEFMSTPAWASLRRATATMLDANAYGALAALAGPVAVISLAPLRLTAGPLLAGLALGINWLGLWMSGSRTALVCGIVGTLALAASMLRSGSWSRSGFRWVAWVTAAVVVTGLLWSSAAIGPLQRLTSGERDSHRRRGAETVGPRRVRNDRASDDPRASTDRCRLRHLSLARTRLLARADRPGPSFRQCPELVATSDCGVRRCRSAATHAPGRVVSAG